MTERLSFKTLPNQLFKQAMETVAPGMPVYAVGNEQLFKSVDVMKKLSKKNEEMEEGDVLKRARRARILKIADSKRRQSRNGLVGFLVREGIINSDMVNTEGYIDKKSIRSSLTEMYSLTDSDFSEDSKYSRWLDALSDHQLGERSTLRQRAKERIEEGLVRTMVISSVPEDNRVDRVIVVSPDDILPPDGNNGHIKNNGKAERNGHSSGVLSLIIPTLWRAYLRGRSNEKFNKSA